MGLLQKLVTKLFIRNIIHTSSPKIFKIPQYILIENNMKNKKYISWRTAQFSRYFSRY